MTKDELILWHRAPATQEVLRLLGLQHPRNYRQSVEWADKRYIDGVSDVLETLASPERIWEIAENAQSNTA